jgi:hypothetical protein
MLFRLFLLQRSTATLLSSVRTAIQRWLCGRLVGLLADSTGGRIRDAKAHGGGFCVVLHLFRGCLCHSGMLLKSHTCSLSSMAALCSILAALKLGLSHPSSWTGPFRQRARRWTRCRVCFQRACSPTQQLLRFPPARCTARPRCCGGCCCQQLFILMLRCVDSSERPTSNTRQSERRRMSDRGAASIAPRRVLLALCSTSLTIFVQK